MDDLIFRVMDQCHKQLPCQVSCRYVLWNVIFFMSFIICHHPVKFGVLGVDGIRDITSYFRHLGTYDHVIEKSCECGGGAPLS